MADKTLYAARETVIERRTIRRGDIVGKGDPQAGAFTPAKGLEFIELGHVIARLETGVFSDTKPKPEPPGGPAAAAAKRKREAAEAEQRQKQAEEAHAQQVRALTDERDQARKAADEAAAEAERLRGELDEARAELQRLNEEIDKAQTDAGAKTKTKGK